ncbi:MAG: FtsX-like permease family protein [Planctomycetota bacterium]
MSKRTSLAWKNLSHSLGRTVVSIGGIGFAIVLMFMQLGFLGSVGETANVVFDRMRCDFVIRSPNYLHVYDPGDVPDSIADAVQSLPAVENAVAFDVGVTDWQNPRNYGFRAIAIMGIDLDQPALNLPDVVPSKVGPLRAPGRVLVDDASSDDFGPVNGRRFTEEDIGTVADVIGKAAHIAGTFTMGTGLAANGALLCSRETYRLLTPGVRPGSASMVLVRLRDGVDHEQAIDGLRERLSQLGGEASYATVIPIDDAKHRERKRWYTETPIGLIFSMGVALAGVVGCVISYMVLASDVQSHLSEYATLRAMGYSNAYLVRTLLGQSTMLALIAFPPALLVSVALYAITSYYAKLPINMTWQWIALVFCLTMLMCNVAGLLALRRLLRAEPATLF